MGWYSIGLAAEDGRGGKNGGNDLGNLFMYHTVDVWFTVHGSLLVLLLFVFLFFLPYWGRSGEGGDCAHILHTRVLEHRYDML